MDANEGMITSNVPGPAESAGLSPFVISLFAFSCGATVANIYYAQSLVEPISRALELPPSFAGLIVAFTQLGYGAGLFFLVCLGDLVENRRLILLTTAGTIVGLIGVVSSHSATMFLAASFILGVFSVGTQVLVPLAVHLSPERLRGRVIGRIMVGLIGGVMLSRPIASFLAADFGWKAVFWVSIAVMLVTLLLLRQILPCRHPNSDIRYGVLLASILRLLATSRPLQRRCIYQGLLYGIFNLFWTAAPLMLHGEFGLSQQGIALFAFAGAGGALSAPIAG
ncbi:MFS transporter, partial [Acidisphaera sp. L21]|uniref:MFS transporter n=1 Tax=Acidisphaera sp. L21 TaxID=1641851 RepID=UPI001C202B68